MSLTVKQFIQQLSIKERIKLGREIGSSPAYMNRIVSMEKMCSSDLAHAMWSSEVNKKLPRDMRFMKTDFEIHRKAKLKQRRDKISFN